MPLFQHKVAHALQLEDLSEVPDVCSAKGRWDCTNLDRLWKSGEQAVCQGAVSLHSVTKSLQIWVLGAEYKLEGPMIPSCRRGDGKAVVCQQVPAKIQDGYDPPRSHQEWKGRDVSQFMTWWRSCKAPWHSIRGQYTLPGSTFSFKRRGNNRHDGKSCHVSPDLRQH